MEHALHKRHGRQLAPVLVDLVPRQLAAVGVDVDVLCAEPALALPQPAAGPEEEHDGQGQVGLEEALGVVDAALDGRDGDVELLRKRMLVGEESSGLKRGNVR